MSAYEEIDNLLHDVIIKDGSILQVILADKTGLTIAHTSRFEIDAKDTDALGAIASAIYLASEQQGNDVNLKGLNMIISEFSNGKIFVSDCGNAVLSIITEKNVNIGAIRMLIKETSEKLKEQVDRMIAPVEEVAEEVTPVQETASEEVVVDDAKSIISDLEYALKQLDEF